MLKGQINRLLKGTVIYGVGNILGKTISLLLLPLYTSLLSPNDYGVIGMLTVFSSMVQPIFLLGIGSGVGLIYFSKENDNYKSAVITSALTVLTLSSLLMIAGSIFFSNHICDLFLGGGQYQKYVIIYSITTTFSILDMPLVLKYQFDEKATKFAALSLINTGLGLGLNVLFVAVLRMGVGGFLISGLIGHIVAFLLHGLLLEELRVSRPNISIAKSLLKVSIPMMPSFAALFFLGQSSKYLLQYFKGLDAIGIFTVGINIGNVISLVTGAIATAWVPFFLSYTNKQREAQSLFGRITTLYVYGTGLLTLCFFIFARPFIMIFVKEAYYKAWTVIGASATVHYFLGLNNLLLPPIYFAKKVSRVFWIQLVAAVFGAALNIPLIRLFGVEGAGAGYALCYLFLVISMYVWNFIHRKTYFNVQYEMSRLLAFFAFFFVVIFLTSFDSKNGIIGAFVIAFCELAAVCAIIYFMLKKDERAGIFLFVRRFLGRKSSSVK